MRRPLLTQVSRQVRRIAADGVCWVDCWARRWCGWARVSGSTNGSWIRRLNSESQQAIRAERARDNNIAAFYFRYLTGLAHGDLGFSRSLNRPVSELLKERLPLTLVVARIRRAGGRFHRSGASVAHRLVACSGRRSRACSAERTMPGCARGGDRSGVFVAGRGQPLGHRAGGISACLSLRQESTDGNLAIAACGGSPKPKA